MTQPIRIPEAWSSGWFRNFYNEILGRNAAESIDAHNTDPLAHPGRAELPVGTVLLTAYGNNPGHALGYGSWSLWGDGSVSIANSWAYAWVRIQ